MYGEGRRKIALCSALKITDASGAPRQKARALVLLMREALRHAVELGIRQRARRGDAGMLQLAKRVTGAQPASDEKPDGITHFAGKIIDWAEHAKEASTATATLR